MADDQLLSSVAERVATIQIDRPSSRNALSPELMDELAAELERLDADDDVRCVVIAGSDDVFASGADIRSLSDPGVERATHYPAASFWKRLAAVRKPVVAAVSGWALGAGCELALACDMCVAAEKSQFGQPEVTLGLIPGGGGTQRLARVLGKQRAMELVLTGRRFSAEQAFAWGVVNQISPGTRWLDDAQELAREVARRAPVATRLGKQAVVAAEQTTLDDGLATERRLFELAMATEDRAEGIEALLKGREPEFKGR